MQFLVELPNLLSLPLNLPNQFSGYLQVQKKKKKREIKIKQKQTCIKQKSTHE